MWSAIISSAATIGAVLYLEGPIVALGLTAVSSFALLVALRASEAKPAPAPQPQRIAAVGTVDDYDMLFPPLRQEAS